MNKKTHFFATLIMVAATAAVLVYANIRHDYAIIILSTYVITISLFMLIYSIVKLFQRKILDAHHAQYFSSEKLLLKQGILPVLLKISTLKSFCGLTTAPLSL